MILRVDREEISKYFVVLIYYAVLSIAYFQLKQHDLFNLEMYRVEHSQWRTCVAVLALLIVAFSLSAKPNRVSHYFFWLHAAFPVIPILVFFSYSGASLGFILLVITAFLLIRLVSSVGIARNISRIKVKSPLLLVWISVLVLSLLVILGGDYTSIDYSLDHVYENREAIAESQSSAFEYIHTVLSKSLLPFLLLYYYVKKDRFLFIGVLLASFGVFFLSQHRAALFFPILTLICYEATKHRYGLGGWRVMGMFVLVVIAGLVLLTNDVTLLLGDVMLRRTFIAPAILNYEYFNFFQTHPFTLFSDSKISLGLIPPVYPVSVPYIISDNLGLPGGHANSGYLGSGFQQAGYFGVFIYSIVIAVLLRYLDALGRAIGNHAFVFSVCASPIFWLINSSDLPGVFLTHGLLVSILLCWLSASYLRKRFLAGQKSEDISFVSKSVQG